MLALVVLVALAREYRETRSHFRGRFHVLKIKGE